MTKLLDEAIAKVRNLPNEEQDALAEVLLSFAARAINVDRLDDETRDAVREGLAQAQRGEFVSDADMEVFFKRHGL